MIYNQSMARMSAYKSSAFVISAMIEQGLLQPKSTTLVFSDLKHLSDMIFEDITMEE